MNVINQFESNNVIDCSDAHISENLLAIVDEPAYHFKGMRYLNRPSANIKMERMTVAFQYFRYGCGGAEKVTYELMKLFAGMGYRVILYTDEPASVGDYPLPEGVERRVTCGSSVRSRERIVFWQTEVASEHIALVVYGSWHSPTNDLDCFAIQAAGAVFILYTHSAAAYSMQIDDATLFERLERCGYAADCVLVLSDADKRFWSLFSSSALTVVNPVSMYLDSVPVRSAHKHGHKILWCGRMDFKDKCPDEALEVFYFVKQRVPDAELVFVGDGEQNELDVLKNRARILGLAGSVCFEGFQANPFPYYRDADIFLMTSVTEGFPMSMSEAMQQGLPVVLYELPYLTLVQECNGKGVFQAPQKDRQTTAALVSNLLLDEPFCTAAGRAARSGYEHVCCIDHEQLWGSIVSHAISAIDKPNSAMAEGVAHEDNNADILIRDMLFEFKSSLSRRLEERDKLVHELDDIVSSRSFKLGHYLSALPRKILALFNRGNE